MTLSSISAVGRGTAFELRCLDILSREMSMLLSRVGGKSDGGVDLQGWWYLPSFSPSPSRSPSSANPVPVPQRLRVLAQCKAEKKKPGPKYVREMEGVCLRHTLPYPVALLLSQSPFSKESTTRALSSPVPFLLLHIPPHPAQTDTDTDANPMNNTSTATVATGTGMSECPPPPIGSAFWNPALAGATGLLRGEFDIRWERSLNPSVAEQHGHPALWWRGQRLTNCIPDSSTH
ncbi:hypothetical protein BJ138DRAFT_1153111 [Hygrophoropsis aurantiaca]|uniref:Uncharacterized protein n=1 Tax=Hygrophoropsis aurantiaca TaxID=72124 RepID=A0ACB8AAL4_9AGAM|nr:hypothetical protein BJ138DRAFT_1153111 [Hygrophoropsis aurantiaca]